MPDTPGSAGAVEISSRGLVLSAERWMVVDVKKIVGLLVIAVLLFFVFTQPASAAQSLQNIGTVLKDGASSVTQFVQKLVAS